MDVAGRILTSKPLRCSMNFLGDAKKSEIPKEPAFLNQCERLINEKLFTLFLMLHFSLFIIHFSFPPE